jgi:hypothetical protein
LGGLVIAAAAFRFTSAMATAVDIRLAMNIWLSICCAGIASYAKEWL